MPTLRQLCNNRGISFLPLSDVDSVLRASTPGYVLRFKAITEDGKQCAHDHTIESTPLESDGYYYILIGHANPETGVCGCCPASWDNEYEVSDSPLIEIDGVPDGQ